MSSPSLYLWQIASTWTVKRRRPVRVATDQRASTQGVTADKRLSFTICEATVIGIVTRNFIVLSLELILCLISLLFKESI